MRSLVSRKSLDVRRVMIHDVPREFFFFFLFNFPIYLMIGRTDPFSMIDNQRKFWGHIACMKLRLYEF